MKPSDLQRMFDEELRKPEARAVYDFEDLLWQIRDRLTELMEDHEVSRTELASGLGVSKSWISKVMNDSENITLWTLFKIARQLGMDVEVQFQPHAAADRLRWRPASAQAPEAVPTIETTVTIVNDGPADAICGGVNEYPLAA